MSETDLASETATPALDPPPDSKLFDDLKTLLLSDGSTVLGEEWVFGEILAVFSLFSDPVTTWVCRKEFVAQLTVEEMAMLKLSSACKRSEVVSLEIERMVLIWLQSQGPGRSKMKTAEYSRLLGYLQRPVWTDGGMPLNPWDIEAGEKTVRLRHFLDSSYATSNFRMTEIGTSSILCKTSLRGVCVQATCPFSHDVERARNKICKRFQNGICTSGEGCGSIHVLLHKQPITQKRPEHRLSTSQGREISNPSRSLAERSIQTSTRQFEPRSVPVREFGGPGQSFASYYSAQSSLRGSSSAATNFSSGFYSGPSRRNPMSFQQSPAYYSAKSSLVTNSDKTIMVGMNNPLSGYLKAVHEKGLVLPLDEELNWSGKENGGQHVEYAKGEVLPFEVIGPIGASLTAQVDKVRCRRILLARKTMFCGRRMTVEEALVEVEHLQNLRHPHIIQLVGSYLQGKKFSVLLYPVADCDLSVFLDEVHDLVQETPDLKTRGTTSHYLEKPIPPAIASMWSFFGCLADAIRYIHSSARKHLDIKPGNILVKKHPQATYGYRVYVADFGISRSFKSMDHSQTDTHIRRTPKYCAPEVWEQDVHGRAADIFSLGCVFMEMLTVLCVRDVDDFTDFRSENSESNGAYHETIDRVFKWSEQLRIELEGYFMYQNFFQTFESGGSLKPTIQGLDATLQMLAREPEKRKLPIFNRGEPGPDGCHTCGDVPEKYEYDEEV